MTTCTRRRLTSSCWSRLRHAFDPKTTSYVLLGFNWIRRFEHQSFIAVVHMPVVRCRRHKSEVQQCGEAIVSSISSVYAENCCSPTTEPCGTLQSSLITSHVLEDVQWTWVRSVRYEITTWNSVMYAESLVQYVKQNTVINSVKCLAEVE